MVRSSLSDTIRLPSPFSISIRSHDFAPIASRDLLPDTDSGLRADGDQTAIARVRVARPADRQAGELVDPPRIDRLLDEPDRAVGHGDVRPAGVLARDSNRVGVVEPIRGPIVGNPVALRVDRVERVAERPRE